MTCTPARSPREGLDLTIHAVALFRRGASPTAVLAAVDQAETSLHRERDPAVFRPLLSVCRIVAGDAPASSAGDDHHVVDAALRTAARALGVFGDDAPGDAGGRAPGPATA